MVENEMKKKFRNRRPSTFVGVSEMEKVFAKMTQFEFSSPISIRTVKILITYYQEGFQ